MPFGNIGATFGLPRDPVSLLPALSLPSATAEAVWQHDGGGISPTVRLYQSTLATTPEDAFERFPTVSGDGEVFLVADARLDNREELITIFGALTPSTVPDSALILAAYERWGTDCADRLLGDFAFILWDRRRSQLYAARDLFGVRPLFYADENGLLLVASTIKAVLSGMKRSPPLDLEYLRTAANNEGVWVPGATPYSSVHRLRQGHRLVATIDARRSSSFGELRPVVGQWKKAEHVFQEFRARLTTAVERRLRSATPIGILLSGGFDSSSLAALADRAVASGRSRADLRSYSAVHDRIGISERTYLEAVLRRCPCVTPTLIPADDDRWSLESLDAMDGLEPDEPLRGPRFVRLATGKPAVDDGCRVLIGGGAADELLLNGWHKDGSLFWAASLKQKRRELRYALRGSPKQLLRSSLVAGLRRCRSIAARWGLVDPPAKAVAAFLCQAFMGFHRAVALAHISSNERWCGAENRRPFLDRRLIEFAMGLSPEYFVFEGRTKRLLRESLSDLLPPEFQTRTTRGDATPQILLGMTRELPRIKKILATSLVVEYGLVRPRRIARLIRAVEENDTGYIGVTNRLLATELWLRRTLLGPTQEPHRH